MRIPHGMRIYLERILGLTRTGAQEDSTDSDNEPVNNNDAGAVTSSTSSGNQAVVNEDPEVRVYMDPPVERPDMDTDGYS